MRIFLTASALAGTRAINKHYPIRWVQRETDLRVKGLRIFLIASLVQEQKNKHDSVGSIIERNQFVCSRFAYIFLTARALAGARAKINTIKFLQQARALAVKNKRKL